MGSVVRDAGPCPVIATMWDFWLVQILATYTQAIKTLTLLHDYYHTDMFGLRTTILICLVTFIVSPVTALPFDAKPSQDCANFKTLEGVDGGPQELCGGVML